jgi:hypothetical protein
MLLLNPRIVKFAGAVWEGVVSVAVDRAAHRTVEEWSDGGPYAMLADVPEQRVRITVVQELARGEVGTPRPGESGTLTFHTSPGAADSGRKRIAATAVVLSVAHELSLRKGALRTVVFAAVSTDGAGDPVSVTAADEGQV